MTLSLDRREKAASKSEELKNSTTASTSSTNGASQLGKDSEDAGVSPEPFLVAEEGPAEHLEVVEADTESSSEADAGEEEGGRDDEVETGAEREPLDVSLVPLDSESGDTTAKHGEETAQKKESSPNVPLFEDPSDEEDGEGAWITPSNIGLYKSQALELVPSSEISDPFTTVSKKSKNRRRNTAKGNDSSVQLPQKIVTGCMTADFAMQNVILQMGLDLVGLEGKRIQKVKNWVLRCHACFK